MTLEAYDAFCRSLAATTHVVQWGGASVWKVGGKVFAIGGWSDDAAFAVSFKCSKASFEILGDQDGLRPAPYLASRGLTWIQRTSAASMDDETLKDYIEASHRIIAAGLTRKARLALGLSAH